MSTGTGKAAPWFDRRSAEGTCPGTPTLYEGAAAVWGDASRASSVAAPLKIARYLPTLHAGAPSTTVSRYQPRPRLPAVERQV